MANDAPDARVLLDVAPAQYVTERTRLVKQARADKDKARSTFYQSLKRPSVGLWAVLAAADADVVGKIVAVTTELGDVQAGGSNPSSLAAATQTRRKALEGFVDGAVKALATFDPGAEKRRSEIRTVVDQLSRNPELAEAWIDGTLREMPDEQFGFGAFADIEVSAPSKPANAKTPPKTPMKIRATHSTRAEPEPPEARRDLAAERAARAQLAEQKRQARKDVGEAARELTAADRRVNVARVAVKDAEKALRVAEERRDAAEREHKRAVAHVESLH